MKKIAIAALSLVLTVALFSGCRPNVGTETSEPTTAPTEATTRPTTAPTVPTTTPTAPTTTPTVPSTAPTTQTETNGNGQTDGTTGRIGRNGRMKP